MGLELISIFLNKQTHANSTSVLRLTVGVACCLNGVVTWCALSTMCCRWKDVLRLMRSNWPSKSVLCRCIQTKEGAKRPSIWCIMHLRPWLTQRRGENTTAALRLGARPHVTRPVGIKTKQLRGANHPTPAKHQMQSHVSPSRPSFCFEFAIC